MTDQLLPKAKVDDVQEDASVGKHTPGPWYAMTSESGGLLDQATVCSEHETDGEPTFIADTMGLDGEVPLEQRKANARLMAAARDMLAAARIATDALLNADPGNPKDETGWAHDESRDAWVALHAAIAKAEGRS